MKRLAVLGGVEPETSAGRGPGEANGCGVGVQVPWEGPNRPGPAVWGRSGPPLRAGGGGPGAPLAAPPFSPWAPRLRVCGPAGAAALERASPGGWRLPLAGAAAGALAPPAWLGAGGGCGGRTEAEEPEHQATRPGAQPGSAGSPERRRHAFQPRHPLRRGVTPARILSANCPLDPFYLLYLAPSFILL